MLDQLRELLDPQPEPDPLGQLEQVAKTLKERPQDEPILELDVEKRRTPDVELVDLHGLQVDHADGSQKPPDREKVAEFVQHLKAGGKFPPIKVNERPDGTRWITDGQHRAAAALICGRSTVPAKIKHEPQVDEAQQVEIVAKVAREDDGAAVELLRGVGAVRDGKRLVAQLGEATVSYLPHYNEFVAKAERGLLVVEADDASAVVEALGLDELSLDPAELTAVEDEQTA